MKIVGYHKKLVALLLPFLLLLFALSVLSFRVTKDMIRKQVSAEIETVTRSVVHSLSGQLGLLSGYLDQVAVTPGLADFLYAEVPPEGEASRMLERTNTVLAHAVEHAELVSDMGIVDKSGVIRCGSKPEMQGVNLAKSDYVRNALSGRRAWVTLFSGDDNQPVAYVASPVAKDGEVLGAVFGVVDLTALSRKSVAGITLRDAGLAVVLDRKGTVLMHPYPGQVGKTYPGTSYVDLVAASGGDRIFRFEEPDTSLVQYAAAVPSTDWTAVFQIDKEELLRPINDLAHYNMIISAVGLGAVILFMTLVTVYSSRVMSCLGGIVEKLSSGNFHLTDTEKKFLEKDGLRRDPLGRVCRCTRNIMDELQSIGTVYREKDEKARMADRDMAEYQALAQEARRDGMLARVEQLSISVVLGRLEAAIRKVQEEGPGALTERDRELLDQDCLRGDEAGKLCREVRGLLAGMKCRTGEVSRVTSGWPPPRSAGPVANAVDLLAPPLEQIISASDYIALQLKVEGTGSLWQAIYLSRQSQELGMLLKTVNAG